MVVRIVLASPRDVLPERKLVALVIERLNRRLVHRDILLQLYEWGTSASPGFNREGRQRRIDEALGIEKADLFIGIMWKIFGTPVHDAESGTEHEFKVAFDAFLENDKPQILFYFKEVTESELTKKELRQYRKVKKFRNRFPPQGLWWSFKPEEFERLLYDHLSDHIESLVRKQDQSVAEVASTKTSRSASEIVADQSPKDLPKKIERPLRLRLLRPGFEVAAASLVVMLLILPWSYWRWNSGAGKQPPVAKIIAEDVYSDWPAVTLNPLNRTRGSIFDENLITLPTSTCCVRIMLPVLQSRDSDIYDVSLVDDRSDAELVRLTDLQVRNQIISFTLNQEMLREGRYRLMLSRDNAVAEFYVFVVRR